MTEPLLASYHCPICTQDTPHPHDMLGRWIGVDFDGTLAFDADNRTDPYKLGEPIMPMVNRVKDWLAKGYRVKIFTARMAGFSYTCHQYRDLDVMKFFLEAWCVKHLGTALELTNEKDGAMEVLWDDRAVRVIKDTGEPVRNAP